MKITLSKQFISILLLSVVLIFAFFDTQTARPANRQDLEQWRFNPAAGSCAPCGAPCQQNQ